MAGLWKNPADFVAALRPAADATNDTEGYLQAGADATFWDHDSMNNILDEIISMVEAAGLTPDYDNPAQLAEVFQILAEGSHALEESERLDFWRMLPALALDQDLSGFILAPTTTPIFQSNGDDSVIYVALPTPWRSTGSVRFKSVDFGFFNDHTSAVDVTVELFHDELGATLSSGYGVARGSVTESIAAGSSGIVAVEFEPVGGGAATPETLGTFTRTYFAKITAPVSGYTGSGANVFYSGGKMNFDTNVLHK